MSQQLSREEQERKYPEYTWDLTTIFKDDEAFEAAFKEVENELGKEEQFKKLGVQIEINLSAENNELPPKEIETYLWIPIVDGYSPSVKQLEMGTCLMDTALSQGKRIFVHCRNGHSRSPTLVAAYLIKYQKMKVNEAIKLIKEKRPEIHIEVSQREALEELERKLNS